MATLYTEQDRNVRKTWTLMGIFLVLVIALGWFLSFYFNDSTILYVAVIFSLVMNWVSYYNSASIALAVSRAKAVSREEYPELYRITENLCITAGIPVPPLYVIEDPSPNAFATGRDKNHAAIAVTTGLLGLLDRSELEGVIAHEIAHIGNRDILLQTVVVTLVGIVTLLSDFFLRMSFFGGGDRDREGGALQLALVIAGFALMILSPFIATIIQLAISRKREFLADATGALITRYPDGLASALEKISSYSQGIKGVNHATAHLYFAAPFGGDRDNDGIPDYKQNKVGFLDKLFMTHPPVGERIAALRGESIK